MTEKVTAGTVMYFALRIASARLDRTVTSAEFVELIDSLIGAAAEHVADRPSVALLGTAAGQARKILEEDPDEEPLAGDGETDPPAGETDEPIRETKGLNGGTRRLSYDDRERIRLRHGAHMEERRAAGFTIAGRGFAANLAAEYGITPSGLHDILRRAGE